MIADKKENLKVVLERVYAKYNKRQLIKSDPLMFVYDYQFSRDREVVGFLASALAYGRVSQIQASVKRLLSVMGESPYEFVYKFDSKKAGLLKDFKHRFNTGQDISELLFLIRHCLREYGSIESVFAKYYNPSDENILPALRGFCDFLEDVFKSEKGSMSRGLQYLLANPARKSPCKRLNMFLRWMVRDDDVDPGVWSSISASKLLVPMDTHMTRLCKILGLYDKQTVTIQTAALVSRRFAEICPEDPVKYDFSLCRIGIVENCSGDLREGCDGCELYPFCLEKTLVV